jgi:Origin recognition complex subunit 2
MHVTHVVLSCSMTASQFNWLFHDVSNFEPYTWELAEARVPSLLAGGR